MIKYKVNVIIDYHSRDISAVFTIDAENAQCAKAVALAIINDFYTRDGDAYVANCEEAKA